MCQNCKNYRYNKNYENPYYITGFCLKKRKFHPILCDEFKEKGKKK